MKQLPSKLVSVIPKQHALSQIHQQVVKQASFACSTTGISSREWLKPQLNDVFQLLDHYHNEAENEAAMKLLDNYANSLHLKIAVADGGRKRNIEKCLTVSVNVEEHSNRLRRTHASFHC